MDFFAEFERHLRDGLSRAAAPPPDEPSIQRMLVHARTLHKWNGTHNLTAVKTPRDWAEALYVDAWLLTAVFAEWNSVMLVDVGSGGGFPALVILAAYPELPAVLFEKVEKKRSFLTAACAAMTLTHAAVAREPFPPT